MLILTPAQVKLSRGFRAMLERWQYDIWLTATFRVRVGEYSAVRSVKHFFKSLNKPHDIRYYDSYIYCWLCVEQKPWHDRCHVHALIQRIDPALSNDLKEECQKQFGEVSAKPYNPALPYRATQYISDKYALGWLKAYDFCKINSKWRWNKKAYSNLAGEGIPISSL